MANHSTSNSIEKKQIQIHNQYISSQCILVAHVSISNQIHLNTYVQPIRGLVTTWHTMYVNNMLEQCTGQMRLSCESSFCFPHTESRIMISRE